MRLRSWAYGWPGPGMRAAMWKQTWPPRCPLPPAGLTGLALLHADLPSSRDTDAHLPYAPTRLEILRERPFVYWALGHWHKPVELNQSPRVIMAGTHQGAHLGESGLRGAYVVELSGGHSSVEFVPCAPLVFHDVLLNDLDQVANASTLAAMVRERLDQPSGSAGCLRLTLKGPCPLWRQLSGQETSSGAEALKNALGLDGLVLRSLELTPPLDHQALLQRPDVLGGLLRLLEQAGHDDQYLAGLEEKILAQLHPIAKNMAPDQRRQWLRERMDQVRGLALRELWQGENGGER